MRLRTQWLCSLALPALLAPWPAAAQPNRALAEQRFLRGLSHFDARRFQEALDELRASYELRPSPNSRLFIARALRELDRLPEAAHEFETTALEAHEFAASDERYRATEEAARIELAALDARLGHVLVEVAERPAGLRVRVNETELAAGAVGLPLAVLPGSNTVRVEAPNAEPFEQRVEVAAGTTARVPVTLRPRAATAAGSSGAGDGFALWVREGRGPLRTTAFVVAGVSAASWVSFAVTGGLAAGSYGGLSERCGGGPCGDDERGAIAAGRTQQAIANVALALGLTTAVGAAVLAFVGPRVEAPSMTRASLTVGPLGLALRGSF